MYKVDSRILLEVLKAQKAIGNLTPKDIKEMDSIKFIKAYEKLWKVCRKIESNYDLRGFK
jgi:hypothetical protein